MRNKLPLAAIALVFVFILVSSFRVVPASTGNPGMESLLVRLKGEAIDDDWSQAGAIMAEVRAKWQKARFWVMLNNGEAEVNVFTGTLSRMEGGIDAEDKATVLSEAQAASDTWEDFMTIIIPLP